MNEKVDDIIKYCPECSRCYQPKDAVAKRFTEISCDWYEDFPSINKKKEICPECI
jgi:ribosomal protein S27AE